MPAFLEGMEREMKDIDAIVNNSETPTFENTILAFDRSGLLLTNVSKVFYNLNGANTNDQMQAIARTLSPLMSKQKDDIYLNEKLFQKIKAVYEKRHEMNSIRSS
ncbi:MAG: M3 family metallopeptidase [Bacteroidales bacterium]|nr:M3 family metallopeptidase [Bacteroidales bacterium]